MLLVLLKYQILKAYVVYYPVALLEINNICHIRSLIKLNHTIIEKYESKANFCN